MHGEDSNLNEHLSRNVASANLGRLREAFRRKDILQSLVAIGIALAGIFVLSAVFRPQAMDFIEYWASGRLLVHHADPYSPSGVFALEHTHGFASNHPLIMLNPPWTMFLVTPLGFANLRVGLFFWILATFGCILVSVRLLDVASKKGPLALIFAPTIACLCSGQSSPVLLLGFSLFLHFHRSRPFLAGVSLLLMAIKPHLFLVFWAVLLADCIYRRKLSILAGGATGLAAATACTMCFDPHVWSHYLAMLRATTLQHAPFPTASMLFRILLDPGAFWLLFVPSAVAVIWALWYYASRRDIWDWRVHGMLLMLVTVTVSPYGFISDGIILLPSIAFVLSYPQRGKYSGWILLIANSLALLVMAAVHSLSSPALAWFPPALLVWFLYATKRPAGASHSVPIDQHV
jgi:hypothetical protein